MALTPCADLSAADWIVSSDRPWQELIGFGPTGFPAYARLRFIPDPAYEGQRENDVDFDGPLLSESAQLRLALETLARHTRTPDDCYFCLWEGWGLELPKPKVVVPNRAYFLFRGPLSDSGDWGEAVTWVPDPAFIWPADRAWCIADDVDPHWAGIGADISAVEQLLADPRIDVVPADPREDQPTYR